MATRTKRTTKRAPARRRSSGGGALAKRLASAKASAARARAKGKAASDELGHTLAAGAGAAAIGAATSYFGGSVVKGGVDTRIVATGAGLLLGLWQISKGKKNARTALEFAKGGAAALIAERAALMVKPRGISTAGGRPVILTNAETDTTEARAQYRVIAD